MRSQQKLSDHDIQEFAAAFVDQMSAEDRDDFLAHPDQWYDGISSNFCIQVFDDGDRFIESRDEWVEIRDTIIGMIEAD